MRISPEMNETLTRTGAETPMGAVFRRYWIPACLALEVPEPDGAPVRVKLLGEDLIVFRDSAGDIGLVDAYCAHRRAPLFYGRNEECGLRCVYHGWKYDVNGNCVDMPSEPPYSKFRLRVSIKAYPTLEAGGIIWTYMGPEELMPPPPDYEWLRAPESHVRVSKTGEDCNFLQAIEGGIDTAHSSFTHNNDLSNRQLLRGLDTHPKLEVDVTDYGFRYASIRNVSSTSSYVRVYQFLMPSQQLRGGLLNHEGGPREVPGIHGHIWVPIDDEHTYVYNIMYSASEEHPITDEFWRNQETRAGRGPDQLIADTHWLKRNPANDFLIDREVQRTKTYTGISGVNTQDFAIQTGMGPIVDRSLEALGSTDRAIQAARRLLLDAARDGGSSEQLPGSDPATHGTIRAVDMMIPLGADWRDVAGPSLTAIW